MYGHFYYFTRSHSRSLSRSLYTFASLIPSVDMMNTLSYTQTRRFPRSVTVYRCTLFAEMAISGGPSAAKDKPRSSARRQR